MITGRVNITPLVRRPASLAAAALFISNVLFALGGLAGGGHRVAFASLYLLSAATAIPMIYGLIVAVRRRGATLTLFGALLLGVAAVGHAAEALITLGLSLENAAAFGPALGVAELVGLVLGILLVSMGLWRAGIAPIWPGLLFLFVVPANRVLPHGIVQQSARSAIVVIVATWLAYALVAAETKSTATDRPTER